MKNFARLFSIVAIIATFSFSSCKSDKDEVSIHPIVGTWLYAYTMEGLAFSDEMMFNADKSGVSTTTFEFQGVSEKETENFTWSTSGTKITIMAGGKSNTAEYSIVANKLTITAEGEVLIYTKK